MKKFIIILVLSLIQPLLSLKCFEQFTLDDIESDIQKEVQNLVLSKQEIQFECLQILIDRGFYKAALELYEGYFMVHQIDIFEQVRNQTTYAKKNFNKFTQTMEISNAQVQQIRPVIEWAQSRKFVFLYMKKALRKDAPGCIDCTKNEVVDIKKNGIYASSFGIITHQPIQWLLNIEFEGEIDVEQSTWRESGVGTYFFNLTKVDNYTLWEKLDVNMAKQPAIWWDMREKYKKDMDAWIKMLDGNNDFGSDQEVDKKEEDTLSEIEEDGENIVKKTKQQKLDEKKKAKREEKQLLSTMTKSAKEAYLYKKKLKKEEDKKIRQKIKNEKERKIREAEKQQKEKEKKEKERLEQEQKELKEKEQQQEKENQSQQVEQQQQNNSNLEDKKNEL